MPPLARALGVLSGRPAGLAKALRAAVRPELAHHRHGPDLGGAGDDAPPGLAQTLAWFAMASEAEEPSPALLDEVEAAWSLPVAA